MKKLLHERLRDGDGAFIVFDFGKYSMSLHRDIAEELADEIECHYVPRKIVDQILQDMYLNAEITDDEILKELADRFYELI